MRKMESSKTLSTTAMGAEFEDLMAGAAGKGKGGGQISCS